MQTIRSSSLKILGTKQSIFYQIISHYSVIFILLILLILFLGDAIVAWRPEGVLKYYWPLLDSPVHAILALLVVSPLVIRGSYFLTFKAALIAVFAAVLLDLDHVIAAGSFSLYDITHLSSRPDTHSLLFAAVCGLLAYLLSRRSVNGWLIFGALASHILRDASSGATPFLWPLPVDHLAIFVSYGLQIGLFLFAVMIMTFKTSYEHASIFINIQIQWGKKLKAEVNDMISGD